MRCRPEDIFGSLEVDGSGNFVEGNGNYQSSGMLCLPLFTLSLHLGCGLLNPLDTGTYRIVTRNGM